MESSKFFNVFVIFIFSVIVFFCFNPFEALSNEVTLIYKNTKNKVRIVFNSQKPFKSEIFVLKNPMRFVVDFNSDISIKNYFHDTLLVKGHRIGNPAQGETRVVFDLTAKLKKYSYIPVISYLGNSNSLIIDLLFDMNAVESFQKNKVIVIDPGHGGRDPGAVRGNVKEKNITLLAAKYLALKLEKMGYKVFLTRSNDKFVRLSNRVKFARKKSADLFISIHADSTSNKKTRGLSIYSLSERASDKLAQSLADAENKVDLIGGIDLEKYEEEVSGILIDIERRGTKNSSIEFAQLVIKEFQKSDVFLLKRPHRQAGFAVLKAPDIPSVLVEMGFISNKSDFNLLVSKKHRKKIMNELSDAVNLYLKRESIE